MLTFVIALLAGGTVLALRAIFERNEPFPLSDVRPLLLGVLAPSITTALVAPALFVATARIESLVGRRAVGGAA